MHNQKFNMIKQNKNNSFGNKKKKTRRLKMNMAVLFLFSIFGPFLMHFF